MKKHTFIFICLILCTSLFSSTLFAQTAIHHPNQEQNLQQRWEWAMAEAKKLSQMGKKKHPEASKVLAELLEEK